ncbi:MAG TPA: hypothetical protein VMY37_17435 [Thermoguttaceae bacterium]|nr:hypothetical protein [Thermoguttaceae bacterium]
MGRERKECPLRAKNNRYGKEPPRGAAPLVVERGYAQAEAARRLGLSARSGGRRIDPVCELGEGRT